MLPRQDSPDKKESPSDERARLTRFLVIITIAISLEALAFIFNAAKTDISTLIYPTFLLFADIFTVLSLGPYHKLTHEAPPTAIQARQPFFIRPSMENRVEPMDYAAL